MALVFTSPSGPVGAIVPLDTALGAVHSQVQELAALGPTGPAGAPGPTGPTGATGAAGGGSSPALFQFEDDFSYIGTADPSAIATAGGNLPTGAGNWCARAVTAAGLVNLQTGTAVDHPGTVDIQAGNTINDIACLHKGMANTASSVFISATQVEQCTAIVRVQTITTARCQIGISSSMFSTTPPAAAHFVYDSSVGANWLCVCRQGGVQTLVDSTIPVVALQWYRLEIRQSVLGTFTFLIDGAERSGGGISANAPTSMVNCGLFVQALAAAVRNLTCDYFSLTSKALAR